MAELQRYCIEGELGIGEREMKCVLLINICQNRSCLSFSMCHGEVLFNPCDEVIFKRPFDDLVQKVWGEEFVDIGGGQPIMNGCIGLSVLPTRSARYTGY